MNDVLHNGILEMYQNNKNDYSDLQTLHTMDPVLLYERNFYSYDDSSTQSELFGGTNKTDIINNIDENNIIKIIEQETKSSMRAIYDEDGSLAKTISNYGLQIGEMATRFGAEYYGLSIKAIEEIRPILTDDRIIRAIRYLNSGDIQKAIGVLRLVEEVYEHGMGFIYAVLKIWLNNNNIPVPDVYIKKAINIKDEKILRWINAFNWAPIEGKFEIVDIGHSKGHSIVPESWLGKIFNNALELHEKMDKLDWRVGKPHVNFCAIYSMDITTRNIWNDKDSIMKINARIGITMNYNNDILESSIIIFGSKKEYINWLSTIDKTISFMSLDLNTENNTEKLIVACKPNQIIQKTPNYIKKRNVGLLVSTLQKLIRRGSKCSKVLSDVLKELWQSPGYNLPEQQFLRVSAARQLTWRLFITSIEDVQAFHTNNPNYLTMNDIACLAIIANSIPDIQFNENIFNKILLTALAVQNIDKKWTLLEHSTELQEEISLKENNDQLLNAFTVLDYYMPLRQWDHLLIKFSYNAIKKKLLKPVLLQNLNLNEFLDNANIKSGRIGLLAGMDMHPYPNLLILFQGSLPFLPYNGSLHTTKQLWHFIWNNSSGINVRLEEQSITDPDKELLNILKNIQSNLLNPDRKFKMDKIYTNLFIKNNKVDNSDDQITSLTKRISFILIFGKKRSHIYKNKRYDIIISGCMNDENSKEYEEYCKVKVVLKNESKYLEGNFKNEIELDFLNKFTDTIESPTPPPGYNWIWGDKKSIHIQSKIINKKANFYVGDYEITPYDGSNVLIKLKKPIPIDPPKPIKTLIKRTLYLYQKGEKYDDYDDYDVNIMMRELHKQKYQLFNWIDIGVKANLPQNLWRSVYIKLINNKNDEILIGPVDGQGNAVKDSINYLYEGTIWRIYNMLSMLYPNTISITRAEKSLKFKLNKNTAEYSDLIEKLQSLLKSDIIYQTKKLNPAKIITNLWDHQKRTKNKIIKDIKTLGRRGFGDASNVGAGKTLTALAVMVELHNYNLKKKTKTSGFLVLLPTTYLYKTWEDEINKHCEGFDMIFQNANGSLTTDKFSSNSILITTLGRMRDHPLEKLWTFVVIDECLSVQNKNALQTEEAWRQIISSQYGVLMASATFFRTRFDKLFYMIKMLNSGLPETKEYLDAILAESIVSNVPLKTREWKVNFNPFKLSLKIRKEYDAILEKDLSSEKLYIKLQGFLFDNFDYIAVFDDVIKKCEKDKRRCLVYTRSKDEADLLSQSIKNATRYPDVSGTHLVISYTEGTYGLNNLIYLDTIVTRFPEPDKLPQMKGRLDRPNQINNVLYIEYVYIDNTIDRAGMLRLEMANRFFNDYIMPLADYYDIAVGKKK